MKSPSNSRNTTSAAWRTFLSLLEYKCEREGTHFVAVSPRGTTKGCASCGFSTEKPLWVGEHSCPACGFEVDRDANAAWNIFFAVSKTWEWDTLKKRLWRLHSLWIPIQCL